MAKSELRNPTATKKVTADESIELQKTGEWLLVENYVEGDIRYHELMPAKNAPVPGKTLKELKVEADGMGIKYEGTITREDLEKKIAKGK